MFSSKKKDDNKEGGDGDDEDETAIKYHHINIYNYIVIRNLNVQGLISYLHVLISKRRNGQQLSKSLLIRLFFIQKYMDLKVSV